MGQLAQHFSQEPKELSRQVQQLQSELAGLLQQRRRTTPLLSEAVVLAQYGGPVLRLAPPTGGQTLRLPRPAASQGGARIPAIVAIAGTVTVEAAESTVNTVSSWAFPSGLGLVDFVLDQERGWFTQLVTNLSPEQTDFVIRGSADPEGSVTAGIGTLYLRTSGGSGTTLYVKESGTGNTGWVGK